METDLLNLVKNVDSLKKRIDADTTDQNLRIDAFPDNIEKDGFTLKIRTWNRSKIFDCRAEWVAFET